MEYGSNWHEVSHIQMLIAQPQLGFIVRDFQRSPVRRFEIIDEGILGGAVHPHAAYLAGNAVIFRLEAGSMADGFPSSMRAPASQRTPLSQHVPEVNGFTQFTPQGGFGLQYFLRAATRLGVRVANHAHVQRRPGSAQHGFQQQHADRWLPLAAQAPVILDFRF